MLDVLNDIFGNLQDLVRSEIHLAKAEVTDEFRGAKSTVIGLGVAILAGGFAILFLLIAAMHALTGILTAWGAPLVVAAAMALVAIVAYWVSVRNARVRREIVPRTAASIEENVEWAKRSIK